MHPSSRGTRTDLEPLSKALLGLSKLRQSRFLVTNGACDLAVLMFPSNFLSDLRSMTDSCPLLNDGLEPVEVGFIEVRPEGVGN